MRLKMLSGLPSHADLQEQLKVAQRQMGSVQLPFTFQDKPEPYVLAVSSPLGTEPKWELNHGFSGSHTAWVHSSWDIALILNLVTIECTGTYHDEISELDQKTTFSNLQAMAGSSRRANQEPPPTADELSRAQVRMSGTFEELDVVSLLQSIAVASMSGRLVCQNLTEKIELYFKQGAVVHAVSVESQGNNAVLELMTWLSGSFSFAVNKRTTESTVTKRTDILVMEGAALRDQYKFLKQHGLKLDCYLLRQFPRMTEEEFESKAAKGLALNLSQQKRLFKRIDHVSTLSEILRLNPMPMVTWVPMLFNLMSLGLITISDKPTQAAKHRTLMPVDFDHHGIEAARRAMLRADSNMVSYPLFLHFLLAEELRYKQSKSPFSVVLFEVGRDSKDGWKQLSTNGLRKIADAIDKCIQPYDVLAHYKTFQCAILLPHTDVAGAARVAQTVIDAVVDSDPDAAAGNAHLKIAFGVAAFPDDCASVGPLLSAAEQALAHSRKSGTAFCAFRELYKKK